ncbi:MAG: hypothetical protein HQ513_17980 [Rhodospirillales bacterium]|nr:hypothetical protein [Rhodospirillales bacterium]
MINKKALAIALTIGVMTATSGIANASDSKSPAEFQAMIEKIHARQATQRADIKDMTRGKGAKSAAEFQAMIEKIHTLQARNRAKVWEIVQEIRSTKKLMA